MSAINVGDGLTLPVDTVTQTFAILAKRGVGKTYLASVMAEEMLLAGQQIVAVDPTGAWWGLRSKFPVVVFGGEHADLPLDENAGEMVARAIVEGRFSAVIDLSLFSKNKAMRFMVGFAEAFYRLNREAVHLFVDEADTVAPQSKLYGGDENRMLGAMEDIVRRGRKRGIGCTLITQRPQVLNKNVLTQCEALFALRLGHPKDIDAIKEWVNVHGDPETAKQMIGSLPSLPVGEAWFWAPAWGNLFRRVKVRKRMTFDSGATPKPGEKPKTPPRLAAVDLTALGEQIKAAAEAAKANDPATLKAELAKLRKELAAKPPATVERVEVPAISAEVLKRLTDVLVAYRDVTTKVGNELLNINALLSKTPAPRNLPHPQPLSPKREPIAAPAANGPPARPPRAPSADLHGATLPKAQRMILNALAQHGASTKSKTAVITNYASTGGGFNNAISWLKTAGFLIARGDILEATEAGLTALGPVDPLPTGQDLIDQWRRQLPKAEGLILVELCNAYPNELSKEELAAKTGYEPSGGGFNNAISKLRTLELLEGRGSLKASASLF